MSADNWTQCPQCSKKKIELNNKLKNLYGKVSLEKYQDLQKEADELDVIISNNLREDYEQGIIDGVYEVHYSARCTQCNFKFKYDFVKDVFI